MNMNNKTSHPQKISFFLFINTKSGGGLGRKYLTVPGKRLDYKHNNSTTLTLHFIDLFDIEGRQDALDNLSKIAKKIDEGKSHSIKVIVCGGDGTVLWVVSLVQATGVSMDKIAFGIIPIGTGNDFSRCLRWGGSPIRFSAANLTPLKQRILDWLQAEQSWFDVWHASVSTYEDGTIIQIRDKNEVDTNNQLIERGFCNYFGVGIDARICYSVERRRQKNKWINLALYACVGLCKLFQKIRPTHQAVKAFREDDLSYQQVIAEQQNHKQKAMVQTQNNQSRIQPLLTYKQGTIDLKEGYGSLLAINSVRYMAGLQNIWNTNKLAVHTNQELNFTEQRMDDGKLQFLSFKSELGLGLQRFINCAAKVTQGQGPYTIHFHRTEAPTPTFIHIDGEAVKIIQLKEVKIRKSQLAGGRIRVMMKRKEQ